MDDEGAVDEGEEGDEEEALDAVPGGEDGDGDEDELAKVG